jgi:hypothetical protein
VPGCFDAVRIISLDDMHGAQLFGELDS